MSDREPDRRPLYSRGFVSLLATQFLGAANDNILKQVLTFMVATGGLWNNDFGRRGLGPQGGQAIVSLCLTVPFIFLSAWAGQMADRFSKRDVMYVVKWMEVPICLLAGLGFYWGELWLAVAAMFFMGVQSTFFGPSKFGVVPELVDARDLSRANGVLNMLSNLAVIIGSMLAGPISRGYWVPARDNLPGHLACLWLPGLIMVLVAIMGVISSQRMPSLQASQPDLRFRLNPFDTYWISLREMSHGPLLTVALAWSTFYMISVLALLIVPEYTELLAVSYDKTSILLGLLGLSVGISSMVCGLVSGDTIRPYLIPWGAGGMTFFLFLLGVIEPEYYSVCVLVCGVGLSAGFYVVPLQALLQYLSPADERGRFMATTNALSFLFISLGSVVYWIASRLWLMPPNRIHLIAAAIALTGTLVGIARLRRIMALRDSRVVEPGRSA